MPKLKLRSQNWFNNPDNPGMTALYLERYLNFGLKDRLSSQNYTYTENQTPWQEIFRKFTGQLSDGACLDLEEQYFYIAQSKGIPRDSH